MQVLSRVELARALAQKLDITINTANKCIDKVFEEISTALINGEEVKLAGFGTLYTSSRKARMGRNPLTKVEAVISARKTVAFRCSDAVKKILN